MNLIELAPKGTGKSYLFGNVSRYGWLSSGGIMSRAKMFYDQSKRREGLLAGSDFVTLDEVQTISFTDTDEMRAALKGYLEQGTFTVGDYKGVAEAGVVLCGNIRKEIMDADGYSSMANCVAMKDNKIYLCSRIANAVKLGLIESDNGIDIYSPKFAREIGRMYGQKLNPLCDFCGVDVNSIVEAGEQ